MFCLMAPNVVNASKILLEHMGNIFISLLVSKKDHVKLLPSSFVVRF